MNEDHIPLLDYYKATTTIINEPKVFTTNADVTFKDHILMLGSNLHLIWC